MAVKRDFLLKLFLETVQSDMLHVGCSEPGLRFSGLAKAQLSYENKVIFHIPKHVRTILEIGCGTGHTTQRLQGMGYQIECLSPDLLQKEIIEQKLGDAVTFHNTTYEDFETSKRFDLLLLMESFGYIKLERCLEQLRAHLAPGGTVLISDVFRRDHERDYKSFHNWDDVVAAAGEHGLAIEIVEEITDEVVPTLTLAAEVYGRFGLPVVETLYQAAMASIDKPKLKKLPLKLARKLFQKQIDKFHDEIHQRVPLMLDPDNFKARARYLIVAMRARDAVGASPVEV